MIIGLLLSAGESTRMGSPKPLLEWHGLPLVQYQVKQLKQGGCHEVVVVLGHRAARVLPFVGGLDAKVVINDRYREGRATSVRAGMEAVPPSAQWIVVLSVDQPRTHQDIAKVVQAARESDTLIVTPVYNGRRGHPVAFSGRLLPELLQVKDETLGLRAVVRRHLAETTEVPVQSEQVLLDLNTPDDYHAARFGRTAAASRR